MAKTQIEWTDATWNPVTGCSPVSAGCQNCYARRMATRLRGRYGYPDGDPFCVTFHPERLGEPLKWRTTRRVFVCSMGDLFHEDVSFEFIDKAHEVMRYCRQHTFQMLTKRPERLKAFWDWRQNYYPYILNVGALNRGTVAQYRQLRPPENAWYGTSVEDQPTVDERIPHLLACPAAVRFVSCEPLLVPVDLTGFLDRIDWVIVGCETGPGRRPCNLEWVADIVAQCRAAGVPCFVKQVSVGRWPGRVSHEPAEWPEELRVREWPNMGGER